MVEEEKKKSTRWASGRVKISEEGDPNRTYLCCLPTPDGEAFLGVLVYPDKVYGTETGREIIAKYLSRNWRTGKLASTDTKRKFKSRHKPRYGNGRSQADWDRVNRLGNPLDDYSFKEHQEKLEELEGNVQGKETYLRKLEKIKKKYSYRYGNQAFCPSEDTEQDRRNREYDDIEDEIEPYVPVEEYDEKDEEEE